MEQAVVPEPQVAAGQAEPQQLEPVAELAGRVQALQVGRHGPFFAAEVFAEGFRRVDELQNVLIALELFGDVTLHRVVLS